MLCQQIIVSNCLLTICLWSFYSIVHSSHATEVNLTFLLRRQHDIIKAQVFHFLYQYTNEIKEFYSPLPKPLGFSWQVSLKWENIIESKIYTLINLSIFHILVFRELESQAPVQFEIFIVLKASSLKMAATIICKKPMWLYRTWWSHETKHTLKNGDFEQ